MKIKNKKFALAFLLIVFLGIATPFQNALAIDIAFCDVCNLVQAIFSLGGGGSMVKDVASGVFNAVLSWLSIIPSTLLGMGQALLSWVISPTFLGVKMTDNVVVNYGWAITRDLANVFLLLGLVVIGLGIILGIEDYQAKKTLPRLIAIALLINFTLVICGFILDFTNLLMNYLLGAGSLGQGFSNEIQNNLALNASRDLADSSMRIIVYFIFGIVAAIVYLLYAFLFIARYVYLWILIIIAPIAFASKVFPSLSQAKQFFPSFFHWDEWWKNFIQWSTIGIYAAFFIALANRLMTAMASGQMKITEVSGNLTLFGALFSYLFPLALLLVGLFSILDTGSSVPGFKQFTSYGKAAVIGAGVVTAGAITGAVAAAKDTEDKRGFGERVIKGAITSEGREKGLTAARQYVEGKPIIGRFVGGPGAASIAQQKELSNAEKEMKAIPKTEKGMQDLIRLTEMAEITKADYYKKLAATKELAARKKLPDSVVEKIAAGYQRSGQDIDIILRADPAFSRHFINPDTNKTMTTQEAVDRFDGKDLAKYLQRSAVEINKKTTAAEQTRIEETVLLITDHQQKFNAMRGLPRRTKLAFADSLRHAYVGLPKFARSKTLTDRVTSTSTDPKWQ